MPTLSTSEARLHMLPRRLALSVAHRAASTQRRHAGDMVRVTKRDGLAFITLNNPKKLNALTVDMGDEFEAAVHELEREGTEGVGAVVLTGEGRAFSAGGDLDFLRRRHEDTPSRNAVIMRRFYERFLSVRRLPVPVIAAINGPAIGAGMCLALACDLRVAAMDAPLGFTFVGIGIHPGMGSSYFLPAAVGPQLATRMLLTGETVAGQEAAGMGLVVEAVEKDQVVGRATALATRMADASPIAVRTCVRTLRSAHDRGLDQALWREAEAQADSYASKDLLEGVNAVAEKRKPQFVQREGYIEDA